MDRKLRIVSVPSAATCTRAVALRGHPSGTRSRCPFRSGTGNPCRTHLGVV